MCCRMMAILVEPSSMETTVEEVKIEEEDVVNGKKVADTKAKITFTNTQISDTSKPNDISGWTAYTPGTTNITAVKNAKSFF